MVQSMLLCLYLLITIMAQVQAVQAVPNVATVTAIRRADQVSGHIERLTRARPGTRGGIESDKEP